MKNSLVPQYRYLSLSQHFSPGQKSDLKLAMMPDVHILTQAYKIPKFNRQLISASSLLIKSTFRNSIELNKSQIPASPLKIKRKSSAKQRQNPLDILQIDEENMSEIKLKLHDLKQSVIPSKHESLQKYEMSLILIQLYCLDQEINGIFIQLIYAIKQCSFEINIVLHNSMQVQGKILNSKIQILIQLHLDNALNKLREQQKPKVLCLPKKIIEIQNNNRKKDYSVNKTQDSEDEKKIFAKKSTISNSQTERKPAKTFISSLTQLQPHFPRRNQIKLNKYNESLHKLSKQQVLYERVSVNDFIDTFSKRSGQKVNNYVQKSFYNNFLEQVNKQKLALNSAITIKNFDIHDQQFAIQS